MLDGSRLLILTALLLGGCSTTGGQPQGAMAQVPPPPLPPAPVLRPGSLDQAVIDAAARITARDRDLRAVIAINPLASYEAQQAELAAGEGRSEDRPLSGKPILIKDNIEVAGMPTTAGSLALAGNDTGRDAPIVTRLRKAGAVILGKTNLSEWANFRSENSISGWSAVGGQTRNPYAFDRNTCGSSSGSGAAVAAGYSDYAIGTETDGSITCPASMNGVVGLKPTVGLVSRTHIIPISASQDTAGPMTRTVAQAAELLNAIAGSDPADPATREADARKVDYLASLSADSLKGQRIGVIRYSLASGTRGAFEQNLALLKAAGAELVDITSFDPVDFGDAEYEVLLSEFKVGINDYLAGSPARLPARTLAELIAFNQRHRAAEMPLFEQEIFEQAEKTKGFGDTDYIAARALAREGGGRSGIDKLLRDNRVVALAFPTAVAAWKIDAVHGDVSPGGGGHRIGSMAAAAGYPHLTVPMALVRGLPVGLSFVGPKWSEARLLSFGHAFEQRRGAFPRPRFLASIEQAPEVEPALQPAVRPPASAPQSPRR